MRAQELRNLYHEFRDLDALAFAGWEFEAAYHALAGAMHCADRLRDGGLLAEVQQLAEEQGQWIDTHAPDHRLASQNATTAGHPSRFALAAKYAQSMLLTLELQQAETVKRAQEGAGAEGTL
jgi:hypothetical protein